jgi:hypothetical protein
LRHPPTRQKTTTTDNRPPATVVARSGNAGAILVLGRDLVMVPKLIHPLPPETPRTPDSSSGLGEEDGGSGGGASHHHGNDTWMQVRALLAD